MQSLSIRDKPISRRAGIETPSGGGGVGISTKVRQYWRKYYNGVQGMLGRNDQVNYLIALDYAGAEPIHRFILKSGEVAIRIRNLSLALEAKAMVAATLIF